MTGFSSEKCATLRVPSVNSWTCAAAATKAAIAPSGRPAAALRGTVLPQASAHQHRWQKFCLQNLKAIHVSQRRCRQEFRQVSNPPCLALPLLCRNYHGGSATFPGHGLRSLGPGPRNYLAAFRRWLGPQSNFGAPRANPPESCADFSRQTEYDTSGNHPLRDAAHRDAHLPSGFSFGAVANLPGLVFCLGST
jgi:hypothetical protein